MFVLVLASGSARPLPGIAQIKHEDGLVLCLDASGCIIERYKPQEVLIYGEEAAIDSLMADFGAMPAIVEKRPAAGAADLCAALECEAAATVIFNFDSAIGGMKIGLCQAHQPLIDDAAKKIALDRLDLRRLAISDTVRPSPDV